MFLQYAGIIGYSDGELGYIWLSLISKSLLAWLVVFGTFQAPADESTQINEDVDDVVSKMLSSSSTFRFVSNVSAAPCLAHLSITDMRLEEKLNEFSRFGLVRGDIVLMSFADVQEFIRDFLAILKLGAQPVILPPIQTLDDMNRVAKAGKTCCATVCIADMDIYAKTLSLRPEPLEALQFHCSGSDACLLSSASPRRGHEPNSKVNDFLVALINSDESMARITRENFQKMLSSMVSHFALQSESIVFSRRPHFDIVGLCAGIICPLFVGADVLLGVSYYKHCFSECQQRFGTTDNNADPLTSAKEIISRWQPTHIVSNNAEADQNQNPMDLSHTSIGQITVTKKADVTMITADAISCLSTNDFHIRNIVSATCPHVFTNTPRLVQDFLSMHSSFDPDKRMCSFHDDDGTCVAEYSYSQLDTMTTNLAWHIREEWHIDFQERVLLVFPPSLDFFVAFVACLKAGVIAVPVPPPIPDKLAKDVPHFSAIVNDCESHVVLTNSKYYWAVTFARFAPGTKRWAWPALSWHNIDKIKSTPRNFQQWMSLRDVAFLQYTSGSTGQPKGVIVPHSALRIQVLGLFAPFTMSLTSDSVMLSWLPHFHDMGLIGCFLAPLCVGASGHYLSPVSFIKKPVTIVAVADEVAASCIAMPNFGFQYLVNKIPPEMADSKPFESMRTMMSGAEPIRPNTVEAFCKKFHVNKNTILCGYGMAENVLGVSSSRYANLIQDGKVCVGSRNALDVLGFTQAIVRIVHPDTHEEMKEGEGEIWIDSLSKAAGYWGKPDVSKSVFYAELVGEPHRRYLRSGDYGFMAGGNLFVCGRLKNMIIIGGKNYYCQDIEQTVIDAFSESIRPGCVIAFSVDNGEEEELVLFAEVRNPDCVYDELLQEIPIRVHEAHGVFLSDVALLQPRSIPKTTSGKLQHSKSKQFWTTDRSKLDIIATASSKLKEESEVLRHQISDMKGIGACDPSVVVLQKVQEIVQEFYRANGRSAESLDDLGGDSLLLANFVRRLSITFGIPLRMSDVLSISNFEDLSDLIVKKTVGTNSDADMLPSIERGKIEEHVEYPVSWNQSQMLTIHILNKDSTAYNIFEGAWFKGSVVADAFRSALCNLQMRHAILRTTYRACDSDDGFSQIICNVDVDLLIFKEVDDEASAIAIMARDAQTGFQLFGGSSIRCHLLSVRNTDRHLLVLNCHHICFDGISTSIFLHEFSALCKQYSSCAGDSNVMSIFDDLPFQYVDFARWQRELQNHPVIEGQRSYWREQLREGVLPMLEFPLDKPRPPVQTFNGSAVPVMIPADAVQQLRMFGHGIGLNMFQCMLSLWALLLCRHSGQEEVVVGVPFHGRDAVGTSQLIGYFVNMLSVRIEVPHNECCTAFFRLVKAVMFDAMSNSMLPFQSIVKESLPLGQGDGSRNSIFQTLLAWGEDGGWGIVTDLEDSTFGVDVTVSGVDRAKARAAKLDLSLLCNLDSKGCLRGALEFNIDLFDRGTVDHLATRLSFLAESVVDNPESNIWVLATMPTDERGRVLFEFNDTTKSFPRDVCLHDLFKLQAERYAHLLALEWQGSQLTYAELDQASDRMARWLQNQGVASGNIVAMQMDKSCEMAVSILGVLKSGGAFLPMDPTWPSDRRRFILQDAECHHLVVTDNYFSQYEWFRGCLLHVLYSYLSVDLQPRKTSRPPTFDSASQPAYVIYTSGSTGTPKGVKVPHVGVVNCVNSWRSLHWLDSSTQCAHPTNYVFDMSYRDFFHCLCLVGGSIVYFQDYDFLSSPSDGFGCDIITTVPSVAAQATLPPSIQVLYCGGEPMTKGAVSFVKSGGLVFNHYGPTETTMEVSAKRYSSFSDYDRHPTSIGHPLLNVLCYVAHPTTLQLQPIGVYGELIIGGIQVAEGYINRQEMTTEKFIMHPWSNTDPSCGSVAYRTGDWVRWCEDGELEFAGRIDSQVKLRGHRIELGDIEHTLRMQHGVAEAVVLLRADVRAEPVLVAYLQPFAITENVSILKQNLKTSLPGYMVPSFFIGIDEWPRTSSGKINRKGLPAIGSPESKVDIVIPRNEIEHEIRIIFAEVLSLNPEDISVRDDFFVLGGNSLSAIRLSRKLNQSNVLASSRSVTVTDVLQRPTVIAAAELLVELRDDDSLQIRSPLPNVSCEKLQEGVEYSVSLNQSQMLTIHSIDPSSAAYNIPVGMWLTGAVHKRALRSALCSLQLRQAILRTTYRTRASDDGFSQFIYAVDDQLLELEEVDDEAGALSIMAQDARSGFNLFGGSSIRCHLLSMRNTDRHLAVMNCHHICFDGSSSFIFLREFAALCTYHFRCTGEPNVVSIFDDLPFQYVDFARWQREIQNHPVIEGQRSYWHEQLREGLLPVLEFPLDKPRPPVQTFNGSLVPFNIPAGTVTKLRAFGHGIGLNLFQCMLSIWALLLCRHSGQEEVVVGVPYQGRDSNGTEDLIGYFVNVLCLKIDVSTSESCSSFFRSVRNTMVDAMSNSMLPFKSIVTDLLPRGQRDPSRNAVFQTMLAWADDGGWAAATDLEDGVFGVGVSISAVDAAQSRSSKLDLSLMCNLDDTGGVSGIIEFNSDLLALESVTRLANSLVVLPNAVLVNPESIIWEVSVIPPGEVGRVLWEFNDSAKSFWRNVLLHKLFETQAQGHPHTTAAEWKDSCLSYAELDRRSDCLAGWLFKNGVRPSDIVGAQIDKSLNMPVVVLGVLKCGGVFLPMDPTWPLDRRAFIVSDACCKFLIVADHYVSEFISFNGCILTMDLCADELEVNNFEVSPNSRIDTDVDASSCSLAFLLYTSGSTGKPKGVRIPHRVFTNALFGHRIDNLESAVNCRIAVSANYIFDAFYMDLFLGLVRLRGVCVLLESGVSLLNLAGTEKLHALADVPSLFLDVSVPDKVQQVFVRGEKVSEQVVSKLFATCAVHNGYGPTEVFYVVQRSCSTISEFRTRPSSIGHQYPNVTSFVLDPRALLLQPIGVWGELLVGGVQVTDGYLNRDQLTADKYITNPWSVTDPSGRGVMYRTGDKVRWYEDGELEFAGRMDFQVKLNGIRVELGEIENALRGQQGVVEVIVLLSDVGRAQPALVAYVQPATVVEKQSHVKLGLQQVLPTYMIPSIFVGIDEWPRTSSGKIDRKKLPAAAQRTSYVATVAPRSEIEIAIRNIFAEVLRLRCESIGVHDDFHSLGGNSLSAIRLARELERAEAFGCRESITVADVLQRSNVAALAELVAELHLGDATQIESRLPKISSLELQEDMQYPVSFNQSQMLTIHNMDPASAAYNMPTGLWLNGTVPVQALRDALRDLFLRHSVLRTTYCSCGSGDVFAQVVCAVEDDPVVAEEVNDETQAMSIMARDAQTGFQLLGSRPIRCYLISISRTGKHLLTFNCHHICFDGTSTAIFIHEFSALCKYHSSCFTNNRVAEVLDELPFQYVDFATWQREVQDHPVVHKQRSYWREQLREGVLPVLEFPVDKPRPPVQTFNGDVVPLSIESGLVNKLHAFGHGIGLNLFQCMLSLWALVLCRHSGQDEVVVGVPYHGRDIGGTDELIGYFVNMLSARINTCENESCSSFFVLVQKTIVEAMSNSMLPFQSVATELLPRIPRDACRSAVFQTMLAWGEDGGWGAAIDLEEAVFGLDVLVSAVSQEGARTSKLDLSLYCNLDASGCVSGVVEFNMDLFEYNSIHRFVSRFEVLLNSAIENSEFNIWKVTIMPACELSRVLFEFNDTTVSFSRDVCLHDLFMSQAERQADAVALDWQGCQLTYNSLDEESERLAHWLQNHRVPSENVVALQMDKSCEMAVAILGILKAGGAFLPMDPTWPSDRRRFILQDADCNHLIVQDQYVSDCTWFEGRLLSAHRCLSEHFVKARTPRCQQNVDSPSQAAYVIYTSGSTGKPKGVKVPHQAVVNQISFWSIFHPLDSSTRCAHPANYVFDQAYRDFFHCLLFFGGTIVYFKDHFEFLSVSGEDDVFDCDMVTTNPSVLACAKLPPCIQAAFCGGEAMTLEAVCSVSAGSLVVNQYGPTETTCHHTAKRYSSFADFVHRPGSIGHSLLNVTSYIAHPDTLQLQPVGVYGELFIGGIQVAGGYLNRHELTSQRFIVNPWSETAPSGACTMYRTGDSVRWCEDGELEFAGRIDFQVKLRGHRIELGEIENALRAQDGIVDAVVLLREDVGADPALVGYLLCSLDSATGDLHELKNKLTDILPAYMVPSFFVDVEEWPRTSSGKIDRKRLPAVSNQESSVSIVAPRNEMESEIRNIFAEVLRLDREAISVHDEFHSLGGNSLSAIRLARELERCEILGCSNPVTVTDILQRSNVAALAELVAELHLGDASQIDSRLSLIESYDVEEAVEYTVSQNQAQLLTVHAFNEASPAYNIPMSLQLQGSVSIEALRQALRRLVFRHSILRTQFSRRGDGSFVQIVRDVPGDALVLENVDSKAAAVSLMVADAQRGFDLFGGDVMRSSLIRIDSEDVYFLTVNVHHVAFDGMSTGILLQEVSSLYLHYAGGRGDDDAIKDLQELPFQYVDFARWQESLQEHPMMEAQRAYWREHLREGSLPVLEFPMDKARPPIQTFEGDSVPFVVPIDLVDQLRDFGSDLGMTMFQVMVALWALLLYRHSGQQEVVIGAPYHGRDEPGMESLIGYFINMLSFRLEVPRDNNCVSFFRSTKETTTGAMQNARLPFQYLVNNLLPRLQRDASRNAVFQTLIFWGADGGFGNTTSGELDNVLGNGVIASPFTELQTTTAKSEFTLSCSMDSLGCVSGTIEYATSLFERRSVERLVSRLVTMVSSVVEHKDMNVWQLPIMPSAECSRVSVEFNDTAALVPRDVYLPDLFRQQVVRQSFAVAVDWRGAQLTYAELDMKSNQFAAMLQDAGVGPGVIVALQFSKSLEMAVAILGTLKSGGAFLPFDPTWPLERRQFVLEDAGCHHLVLQDHHTTEYSWFPACVMDFRIDSQLDDSTCRACGDSSNQCAYRPEDVAYVLYTSGSTGKPKGVQIPHRGPANYYLGTRCRYYANQPWRFGMSANYVFDAFYFYFFSCLGVMGATCVFLNSGLELASLADEDILHAVADVPSVISQVPIPKSVRQILCTGEAMTSSVVEHLMKTESRLSIRNNYGPTECSDGLTSKEYCGLADFVRRPGSIGRPMSNVAIYIVHPDTLNLHPIGSYGELLVGGIQVTSGYLNRPALTNEKFIANQWIRTDPSGCGVLYRTGDLGRWCEDGEVEFAGRMDFQIKLRGHRIELGEIETVLRSLDGIAEAVVLLRNDVGAEPTLVAYVHPCSVVTDVSWLKQRLEENLPGYMVPSFFVGVDEWPRTSSGKIDRKLLPAPDQRFSNAEIAAPRNETEITIHNIFTKVLGLNPKVVGVNSDFFSLGGNSLSALRLVSQLQNANLGLGTLTAADVMLRPNVASLASLEGKQVNRFPPIERVEVEEGLAYPTSWNQNIYLRFFDLNPYHCGGNICFAIWMKGTVNARSLSRALRSLQMRHWILRTTYHKKGNCQYEQIILPASDDVLVVQSVDYESDAMSILTTLQETPFDLYGGRVVQSRFIAVRGSDKNLLALNIHHVACDGVSVSVLLRDVARLYAYHLSGYDDGHAFGEARDLSWQYVDFACWQHRILSHAASDGQRAYWSKQLRQGRLPVLDLPTDKPRPRSISVDGDRIPFSIPVGVVKSMRACGRDLGLNLFQVMLSIWSLLICRTSGQNEVVVGVPYHGRDQAGASDVVGYLVNRLALLLTVPENQSVRSYLLSAGQISTEGLQSCQLPIQFIINELLPDLPADPSRNPVFQTYFAWEPADQFIGDLNNSEYAMPNVSLSQVDDLPDRPYDWWEWDISLGCGVRADGTVSGAIYFSTALFDRCTVERLAERLIATSRFINLDNLAEDIWCDVVDQHFPKLAPRNEMDEAIHAVFTEVLDLDPDHVSDGHVENVFIEEFVLGNCEITKFQKSNSLSTQKAKKGTKYSRTRAGLAQKTRKNNPKRK